MLSQESNNMNWYEQDRASRHVNAPQIKLQGTRDGFNVPVAAVEVHVSRVRRFCEGPKGIGKERREME